MHSPVRWALGGATFAAALAVAAPARATNCADLPTPVYGIGGSASKPFIGKVAGALTKAGAETIVYQAPGACFGINALISGTKLTGTASYWDATSKEQSCDLDIAGVDAQFANMGNTADACPGVGTLPSTLGDFPGPVQAYTFIVPSASSQQSFSSAAGYFVLGFGQAGQAAPWTDETEIFRRDQNSAVQLFVSLATGVPADKFKGIDTKNNAGTVTAVAGATNPENAIGIVGGEVADANRDKVRILAYQHKDQTCGYWPDSSVTAFDKQNVRTGQYYLWNPQHFYAAVDGSGKISDPAAAKVVGYYTDSVAPPTGIDVDALAISAGTVPKCAMEVDRSGTLGDVKSYAPAEPCGCFFDQKATGTTSCTACTGDPSCPASAPHCRHGYCEVN